MRPSVARSRSSGGRSCRTRPPSRTWQGRRDSDHQPRPEVELSLRYVARRQRARRHSSWVQRTLWGAAPLTSPGKRQTRYSYRPELCLKLNSSLICARSMVALWSAVNQELAELQDSVQDSRRRRRDVERIDRPERRQRDGRVAGSADAWAEAATLGSEDD